MEEIPESVEEIPKPVEEAPELVEEGHRTVEEFINLWRNVLEIPEHIEYTSVQ